MLPPATGRILRELCTLKGPTSQAEIAQAVGCSRSLVTKVVGMLERKRYLHKPTRTSVALANPQYLVLYWAFQRDLEDDPRIVLETSLESLEIEDSISDVSSEIAFTAYTAARMWGAYETPYSEVYAYDLSGEPRDLDLPKGKSSRLSLLPLVDQHLASRTVSKGKLRIVPIKQAYVDLISIATWEAKYAAMSLSKVDPHLPLIGSRPEMGEYL